MRREGGHRRSKSEGGLVRRSSKSEGGPGRRSAKREGGFTLVEVLISTLVMTIGLVGLAGMLAATATVQISARESARSVRLAQTKMDELMKLPFTNVAIAVGGNLDANVANYNESPDVGTTIRWVVTAGPTDDTRALTVRVINNAQLARRTELSSIIREW